MTMPTMFLRRIDPRWLLGLAVAATATWLWLCWCLFPERGWNDVRLAPLFGLRLGLPLYAGTGGPASTWMYGPLPLLLLWPATWAVDAGHALLIAGGINLAISLGAILAVCAFWPGEERELPSRVTRVSAALLALAIWPGATWQYLQADNSAIALGLLANLVLVRARSPLGWWAAAVLATAGLLCKQTSLSVPAAQLIWLGFTHGRGAARDHLLRLAAGGAAWSILFLLGNDLPATWFNLILTPGALPWADRPWQRLWDLSPFIAVHLGLPILAWPWLRRAMSCGRLALPTWTWICAWLPGLASILKVGGTLNTLQGFPLWLPPAMVAAGAALESRWTSRRTCAAAAMLAAGLCVWRIALLPAPPWQPRLELYREAEQLAEAFPEQIWFPWHPLVTVFSEHRLYHVEDGLYVRFITGRPLTVAAAQRDLPRRMSVIALPRTASDWGIALSLLPPNARKDVRGLWTLYSWPPPAAAEP